MKTLMFAMVALASACAVTHTVPVTPPATTTAEASRWASRPECEQLVDHLQKLEFLDQESNVGRKQYGFMNASTEQWFQSRVNQCTITLTKGDYDCLIRAHDTRTAEQCTRRDTGY